ncbi:MAG: hypothetical protein JW941_13160 [Candidatus Coatesbacteria bacterium]|nr:hypothetical protein [Candidatus Coatesbacteria bacterium]
MKYSTLIVTAVLLAILAMYMLGGAVRLVALMSISVLFSVIFLATASTCPRIPGALLLAIATSVMAASLASVLRMRCLSISIVCMLGAFAPAMIASIGASALFFRDGAGKSSPFGDTVDVNTGRQAGKSKPNGCCGFLSRDAFTRSIYGFFIVLIAVVATRGLIGVTILVMIAALVLLIASIPSMNKQSRHLGLYVVIGVVLVSFISGHCATMLSMMGLMLFPASIASFLFSSAVIGTAILMVVRRSKLRDSWSERRGVLLRTSADADLLKADELAFGKSEGLRPVYASQSVKLGPMYAAIGAIVAISIVMAFGLNLMTRDEPDIASSEAKRERIWMEGWLKEIVDEAPDNIRKMRASDEIFQKEIDELRSRAGMNNGWQLSVGGGNGKDGAGNPRPANPLSRWRRAFDHLRPGVSLYAGQGERKTLLGDVMSVSEQISAESDPGNLPSELQRRISLRRPDGEVEDYTIGPSDEVYVMLKALEPK